MGLWFKDNNVWTEIAPGGSGPGGEYNYAVGGEVNTHTVDGKWYKTHTFTGSGTFEVIVSAKPFRTVLVGGGGGGRRDGGQGGEVVDTPIELSVGSHAVTVGDGGSTADGAQTVIGATIALGGLAGPDGTIIVPGDFPRYQGGAGGRGVNPPSDGHGGAGVTTDIRGVDETFAGGGGGGAFNNVPGNGADGGGNGGNSGQAQNATANTGGGGGGECLPPSNTYDGSLGGSGIAIISYEIETPPYNQITGGVATEFTLNGKYYRSHTFTETDTAGTIDSAVRPFQILMVGGGYGASGGCPNGTANNAGASGGKIISEAEIVLGAGGFTAHIGGSSSDSTLAHGGGFLTSADGASVGGGGSAGGALYNTGGPGGAGIQTLIRGVEEYFGGGGGGGGGADDGNCGMSGGPGGAGGGGGGGHGSNFDNNSCMSNGANGAPNTGGGGGGGGGTGDRNNGNCTSGGSGGSGIIIITYEITAPANSDFNEIAGGTVTEFDDGTGQWRRVHTFAPSDTSLSVLSSKEPFRVLIAAAGGGTGYRGSSNTTGGAGAGGLWEGDMTLDLGVHDLLVGNGGIGGGGVFPNGGNSSLNGTVMLGGGYGTDTGGAGSGGSGGGGGGDNDSDGAAGGGTDGQGFQGGSGKYGGPAGGGGAGGRGADGTDRYDPDGCSKGIGGPGVTSSIRGVPEVFCAGGRASVGSIFGGGANGGCGGAWGTGQNGVVIVSYPIETPAVAVRNGFTRINYERN